MTWPEQLVQPLLIGLVLALGSATQRALGLVATDDRLAYAGRALGLGSAALALLVFVQVAWGASGLGLPGLLVLAGAASAAGWWLGRGSDEAKSIPLPRGTPGGRLLFALACIGLLAVWAGLVLESQRLPATVGDEAAHWGMRAQAMHLAGSFGAPLRELHIDPMYPPHSDYPLWNPLLRVAASFAYGEFSYLHGRVPIQLAFAGCLLLCAASLRRFGGPALAALALFACFGHGQAMDLPRAAFSEGQLAFGLLLALEGALRFRETGAAPYARLVPVGLGLALFAKNDGVLFVAAVAIGAVPLLLTAGGRARVRGFLGAAGAWSLAPMAFLLLWLGFNRWHGFRNDLVTAKGAEVGLFERLIELGSERFAVVLGYLVRNVLLEPRASGGVFVAWLAAIVLSRGRLRLPGAHAAILVSLGGLVAVYVTTPQELLWHLDSSAARVIWPLLPCAALLAVAEASRAKNAG